MVLILVETPAGYGLFKVEKPGLLTADAQSIYEHFESADKAKNA
jgi:hypothetical protein